MVLRTLARTGLTAVGLLGIPAHACALDGEDFAARLLVAFTHAGYAVTYESVDVENDDVTLKGVVASLPHAVSGGRPGRLEIGSILAQGATQDHAGGYAVGTVVVPRIVAGGGADRAELADTVVTGMSVPATPSVDMLVRFDAVETGPLKAVRKGEQFLSIASMAGSQSHDGNVLAFTASASGLLLETSALPGEVPALLAERLGLRGLSGSFVMEAGWDVENGTFAANDVSVTVDGIGLLGGHLELEGYTRDLARVVASFGKADGLDQDARSDLLQQLGRLALRRAGVHFQDHGMMRPLIGLVAERTGMSIEQVKRQVQTMATIVLAGVEPEELRDGYADALASFLAEPDAISVAAEPAAPVALADIARMLAAEPHRLPHALGISVGVND